MLIWKSPKIRSFLKMLALCPVFYFMPWLITTVLSYSRNERLKSWSLYSHDVGVYTLYAFKKLLDTPV